MSRFPIQGYSSTSDLAVAIVAAEFSGGGFDRVCEFRAREAFRGREMPAVRSSPGLLASMKRNFG
jgi:hypothetical protein